MNLDIMYFATYEEQKELFEYLLSNYQMYVFESGVFFKKEDTIIDDFLSELPLCYRRVNGHNTYLFSFDKDVYYRELPGTTEYNFSLHGGKYNPRSINVTPCSYEDNMILFGRLDSVIEYLPELDEFFINLKKWMKGKYKKKGRWYISKTIMDNPSNYRLIPVAGNLQPKEYDLKIK